jgi:hypothetical protein
MNLTLARNYHIFTTADVSSTVPNNALSKLHNQAWMGNIVVAAVGKRDPSKIVQFPLVDVGLLDILVSMYVVIRFILYHLIIYYFTAGLNNTFISCSMTMTIL